MSESFSVDAQGKTFRDEFGEQTFIEIVGPKNLAVAYVRDDGLSEGKGLARAHLFAAAPDLLKALQYAAQQMAHAIDQDLNLGELHPDDFFEALGQAEAVIADLEAKP